MGNQSPANIIPQLAVKEMQDVYTRRNFQNLADYFSDENQLLKFKIFEFTFDKAQSNFKAPHGQNAIPQDLIVTQITGPGIFQVNHGLFDRTNMDFTVTDACRVRFYVGTYWNFQSTVQPQITDITQYYASPPSQSPLLDLTRTINAQVDTKYTFILTDGSAAGGSPLVTFGSAGGTTVTVPTNSSVAFPTGTQIDCLQLGTGKVTFAPANGVTLNSQSGSRSIAAQYVGVSLLKVGKDSWVLFGNLVA